MPQCTLRRIALIVGASGVFLGAFTLKADDSNELKQQVQRLQEQNAALEQQLRKQQSLIEDLSKRVNEIQASQPNSTPGPEAPQMEKMDEGIPTKSSSLLLGKVNISGEGGVAFFRTAREGMFPNNEFRLDEARLFVEAPVVENLYLFSEIDLATREEPDVQARLGEFYVDFENVSQLWNQDREVNIRAGRIYIPFGEEYLSRFAIDDPFVSHSLSDLWGIDEGIELYGSAGKFSYALAVQNGGIPDTRDFTSDKSVAARVSYDPTPMLHVSLSGMRTGEIDAQQDQLSALWFGSGFLRSLGSGATTRFQAELAEADIQLLIPHGHLGAFGGYVHYHDNDPIASNTRDVYYYSLEGVHDILGKLYAGARFSQILAANGFPIVGNGDFGDYLFGPLTTDLWRLSLDLGYRWNQNLLLKAEYTFERGSILSGGSRNQEDLFAVEAAFRF